MDAKKSLWTRVKTSTVRLPLAAMVVVPMALMCGYGGRTMSDPAIWFTPAPMFVGLALIGMLMMIAGVYILAEAARPRGIR
jgi:hypothetical protein